MLPSPAVASPPGFVQFRWRIDPPVEVIRDVAVAFKVPGSLARGALAELLETASRGPDVPDAVVLLQVQNDAFPLTGELTKPAIRDALLRFKDRLPLLLAEVSLVNLSVRVVQVLPQGNLGRSPLVEHVSENLQAILHAGLSSTFHEGVVIAAPEGYAFLKPSGKTSRFFIRAEAAMGSSGDIAFCALALWSKIVLDRGEPPRYVEQLMLDTMAIAPVAFALRELFALADLPNRPVIESFHSYGGIENVPQPIRGSTVCLISASSSMEMHREWLRTKRVSPSDVITLVTYADCEDSGAALFLLPIAWRRPETATTAAHHIRISGETFSVGGEAPIQVLLRKNVHAWPKGVDLLRQSVEEPIFDLFRPSDMGSPDRRGLYVESQALVDSKNFARFLSAEMPHRVKAVTRLIAFQDDPASEALATRVALYCTETLRTEAVRCLSFSDVAENPASVPRDVGVIAVAAVVGAGSSILTFSRNLRGVHRGPRLYVIGVQVANTQAQIKTFDANLVSSAHGGVVDVLRYGSFAIGPHLAECASNEIACFSRVSLDSLPAVLAARHKLLSSGWARRGSRAMLPPDLACVDSLVLRKDFVFWTQGYVEGPHHAAVTASIAVLLQRARESEDVPVGQRLFAARPTHITLDPENFTRFDDGIIQAAILRSASPSELDYRSDHRASAYLATYLIRCAKYLGSERAEAALEFLSALAVDKLRLLDQDVERVLNAFDTALKDMNSPLAEAGRWFVHQTRARSQPVGANII